MIHKLRANTKIEMGHEILLISFRYKLVIAL